MLLLLVLFGKKNEFLKVLLLIKEIGSMIYSNWQ